MLGFKILDFNINKMATQKGETIEDTIRMCLNYVDTLIIRSDSHEHCLYAKKIKSDRQIIINAGSGNEHHPSQALLDYSTLLRVFGKEKKTLPIEFLVKAPYRPAKSLMRLMLKMGYDISVNREVDVLYIGRGWGGTVDLEFVKKYPNAYIMHPLPRNKELSISLDNYEKSLYFKNAFNSKYVYASILKYLTRN